MCRGGVWCPTTPPLGVRWFGLQEALQHRTRPIYLPLLILPKSPLEQSPGQSDRLLVWAECALEGRVSVRPSSYLQGDPWQVSQSSLFCRGTFFQRSKRESTTASGPLSGNRNGRFTLHLVYQRFLSSPSPLTVPTTIR